MESWYFRQIKLLNLWDSQETINPLEIPTPTPAPDLGGPVAKMWFGSSALKVSRSNIATRIGILFLVALVVGKPPSTLANSSKLQSPCFFEFLVVLVGLQNL